MSEEIWVRLRDEEGDHGDFYEVSSLGRVRSKDRHVRTKGNTIGLRKGKLLSVCTHANGYKVVGLRVNGRQKQRIVSRLVAFSFHGDPNPGDEACHNNGDRGDNRVENIRWDTKKGNAADKERHGTNNRGSTNPRAQIDEQGVDRVVALSRTGMTQAQIASEVGVLEGVVNHIITGRTWSHRTGIQFRPKHTSVTPPMVRRMRMLKTLGCRLEDIGAIVGVSKACAFRYTVN